MFCFNLNPERKFFFNLYYFYIALKNPVSICLEEGKKTNFPFVSSFSDRISVYPKPENFTKRSLALPTGHTRVSVRWPPKHMHTTEPLRAQHELVH
jgi:hypothetical protein